MDVKQNLQEKLYESLKDKDFFDVFQSLESCDLDKNKDACNIFKQKLIESEEIDFLQILLDHKLINIE
ncbi:MAG: hypothetical protein JW924_13360 [Fusobacteriaceae bacterium]|jgi:hypothetical protein|nr:hypothetical protein [Fusobacteriaceae bacterium]